ncbi:factor H binding protein domain-containing protein [Acinetobacter baumannii]|uniref:factor H binding protein domain-containing protein n=1 Tax=Acinetobacter baumannii TaxID=470 RepID=UPI003FA4CAC9
MNTKILLTAIAFGVATSISHAGINDFKFSTNQTGFVFDNAWYSGTAYSGGKTFSPGATLDLTSLPAGFTKAETGGLIGNKIYRVYNQNYSTVVGNITAGSADRSFIKDVVGQNTALSALPSTGTYTYTGKSFTHMSDGDFTYTLNLNNQTGSGSFSNLKYAFPAGTTIASGTLNSAALTVNNGVLGVQGGTATVTTTNSTVNSSLANFNFNYDLGVFGPNAEEVAGRIYGKGTYGIFGTTYDLGIGVAGKR